MYAMNSVKEFSQSIIEQLGFYVYLLIDPETEQIFYIGKGTGNRIFAHINQALVSPKDTDKLEKTVQTTRNRCYRYDEWGYCDFI